MSKDAVSQWDTDPNGNSDIGGIALGEGIMLPSAVNNAFREMMSQVKEANFSSGAYAPGGTDVAISDGGTGQSTAAAAFDALKQAATTTATGVVERATVAEIWTGTATTVPTVADLQASLVEQTLTDGATVTVDFSAGINFKLDTIGGNRTFAASNLTNVIGRSGVIRIKQDGTGSRTGDFSGSPWVNVNGQNIVLSTTASAEDELYYRVKSATSVLLSMGRALS